jgi:hypothetical protein
MQEPLPYEVLYAIGYAEGLLKGATEEARKILRMQGDGIFGPPDPASALTIDWIDDLDCLEDLLDRLQTTSSWPDLLRRLKDLPWRKNPPARTAPGSTP